MARTVLEGPRGHSLAKNSVIFNVIFHYLAKWILKFIREDWNRSRFDEIISLGWIFLKGKGSIKRDLAILDVPLSRGNRLYAPISVPRPTSIVFRIFGGKSSIFSQIPVQIPFVIRSGDSTSGWIFLVGPATRQAKKKLQASVIFFFFFTLVDF